MSNLDIDVEDNASIMMRLNNNSNDFTATINMSFVQKTPLRSFQIFGEDGNITWNISENIISIDNFSNNFSEVNSFEGFNRNDMFQSQLRCFIDIVRNQNDALSFSDSALNAHKIAMAVKKSISEGLPVFI